MFLIQLKSEFLNVLMQKQSCYLLSDYRPHKSELENCFTLGLEYHMLFCPSALVWRISIWQAVSAKLLQDISFTSQHVTRFL